MSLSSSSCSGGPGAGALPPVPAALHRRRCWRPGDTDVRRLEVAVAAAGTWLCARCSSCGEAGDEARGALARGATSACAGGRAGTAAGTAPTAASVSPCHGPAACATTDRREPRAVASTEPVRRSNAAEMDPVASCRGAGCGEGCGVGCSDGGPSGCHEAGRAAELSIPPPPACCPAPSVSRGRCCGDGGCDGLDASSMMALNWGAGVAICDGGHS
mmetsp:Transcript_79704/g.211519  ORF Transcript_79704/g.211519 Transcript_79704/m.211519 type:complete len:216 (+) Transcript_79704:191-838(+)